LRFVLVRHFSGQDVGEDSAAVGLLSAVASVTSSAFISAVLMLVPSLSWGNAPWPRSHHPIVTTIICCAFVLLNDRGRSYTSRRWSCSPCGTQAHLVPFRPSPCPLFALHPVPCRPLTSVPSLSWQTLTICHTNKSSEAHDERRAHGCRSVCGVRCLDTGRTCERGAGGRSSRYESCHRCGGGGVRQPGAVDIALDL
jgi:hypothetical protein